jgi:hypothetical protein
MVPCGECALHPIQLSAISLSTVVSIFFFLPSVTGTTRARYLYSLARTSLVDLCGGIRDISKVRTFAYSAQTVASLGDDRWEDGERTMGDR